ncbi:PQQ-dependent sugar dehydrogenase [Hydrogenophaga sp.]|uniref:PQQ-dependent sugar dehydrogenase n=1 Tax=Hydrogenophaga sp. TaxID=1904254 RepID=UPI003F6E84BF
MKNCRLTDARIHCASALLVLFLGPGSVHAQLPPGDGPVSQTVTVLEPTPVKFRDDLLTHLKVPPGFRIAVFARDLENVRWLAPMPNGDVYVSRREQGDVLLLRDGNQDGVAEQRVVVVQNLKGVHGLATRGTQLYMTADKKVLLSDIQRDGTLSNPRVIIDDLPDAGQHPNRTMGFGPDGLLYITVGSTCNDCRDANPENATLLRVQPDGQARGVFAKGLRNTIGFGWHPVSGQLYGFDHGSDYHGDDTPPEELNHLRANQHYGWPFCFGSRQPDPMVFNDPPGSTKADFCPTTQPPALAYIAHAAPIGFTFYSGQQFPAEFRNDAFVAFRGSWNRAQPSGYRVARVRFDGGGRPVGVEDFATGWLLNTPPDPLNQAGVQASASEQQQARRPAQFGRLAGLAIAADGSLLVAEDQNGVIYRISYAGR